MRILRTPTIGVVRCPSLAEAGLELRRRGPSGRGTVPEPLQALLLADIGLCRLGAEQLERVDFAVVKRRHRDIGIGEALRIFLMRR